MTQAALLAISTLILSEEDGTGLKAQDVSFSKKACTVILKAVLGRLPERDELVKMMKGKFLVPARNFSSLTFSEVMEVTARKLVNLNCFFEI